MIIDITEYTLKQKWVEHVARIKDYRCIELCTEWQPWEGRDEGGDQVGDGKTP